MPGFVKTGRTLNDPQPPAPPGLHLSDWDVPFHSEKECPAIFKLNKPENISEKTL